MSSEPIKPPTYVPLGKAPAGERAPLRLGDCPILADAVEAFLEGRSAIESSAPVRAAMADLEACTDANALFATGLRAGLFSMSSALEWALFVHHAGAEAERLGEVNFTAGFDGSAALALIGEVYDTGMKDAIYSNFEEPADSDDDYYSDSYGEEDGGDAGGEPGVRVTASSQDKRGAKN